MQYALELRDVAKTFTMHLRGGAELPVISHATFALAPGECAVLAGPSGAGKSTLLRMIHGNYRCEAGHIWVRELEHRVDVGRSEPRDIIRLRRETIGYVSQFLRVIPRVSAITIVSDAARAQGVPEAEARQRAMYLLDRLNVPEQLWSLPPATFSGGEQQRINIARGFIARHPVLLLDEPTASLDAHNRDVVVDLINARKRTGTAILGIFHDQDVRERVADREIDVASFRADQRQ